MATTSAHKPRVAPNRTTAAVSASAICAQTACPRYQPQTLIVNLLWSPMISALAHGMRFAAWSDDRSRPQSGMSVHRLRQFSQEHCVLYLTSVVLLAMAAPASDGRACH